METIECRHDDVTSHRSNYGDGSPRYDFFTDVCDQCGEELGESED